MKGETHTMYHLAVAIMVGTQLHISTKATFVHIVLGIGLFVFFATTPDIDLKVPFMRHRGLSHTFLAAGIVGFGGWYLVSEVNHLVPDVGWIALPKFVGLVIFASYSQHIIEDMFTVGGGFQVEPLWPISNESWSIGFLKSDSPIFVMLAWLFLFAAFVFVFDTFGIINIGTVQMNITP